jgi:hypothetical protein
VRRRLRAATIGLAVASAIAVPACATGAPGSRVSCTATNGTIFILAAQAVPTATRLPCVATFPAGWTFDGSDVRSGEATFWLDNDRAGIRAVEVDPTRTCNVADAVEVSPGPDEAGTRRFEQPISLRPAYQANRYYLFEGGCTTYRFRFTPGAATTLALEAGEALSFRPRAPLVDLVRKEFGQRLCGAGAAPCMG